MGLDTADYATAADAVTVNLTSTSAQLVSTLQGTDTLSEIENVIGSALADSLTGDTFANVLSGMAGNDTVFGGFGADTLNGGEGNDTLWGNQDNDQLNGDNGNDLLNGGQGNDTLIGGVGNDTLTGGAGSDTFRFESIAGGFDTVIDFEIGVDRLQLVSSGFTTLAGHTLILGDSLQYDATSGVLSFDADGSGSAASAVAVALLGVSTHPGALTSADLQFA